MKFFVEQWHTDFGSPVEHFDEGDVTDQELDLAVESDPSSWVPVAVSQEAAVRPVAFIDGVRRVDARVWIESESGPRLNYCASCAAGVARCNGRAHVERFSAERFLIGPELPGGIQTPHGDYQVWTSPNDRPETLENEMAQALSGLEASVAASFGSDCLMVIDGPLRGRENIPGAIGFVKSHHRPYLSPKLGKVIAGLSAGERTPIFVVKKNWTRYTWYMRLPCENRHSWAGVVRCEAPPTLSKYEAISVANAVTATLPSFASAPHKDGRAPQNLYPIKGLEDCLRSRLGDADLMFRSISSAAK